MFSVGPGMKLPLHGAGDHNAFPTSSCSSSCSSSSSPESLRSLSSLSRGWTGSPLDDDMLEVTETLKTPAEEQEDDEEQEEVGRTQTEPLSNDNSTSVYLDADGGFLQDSWNHNQTLPLSGYHGNSGDLGGRRRRRSPTPDSDATEIPDDEDEGSAPLDSPGQTWTESSGSEDLSDPPQGSACHSPSDPVPAGPSPPGRSSTSSQTSSSQRIRPAATKTTTAATIHILELKRLSKPDLKHVRATVGSRSTTSPQKPASQNPAERRTAGPRPEEEVQSLNRDRRSRTSRGSTVLRPVTGRSCSLRTRTSTRTGPAGLDPAQPKKKKRETLSTSSSLGSGGPQDPAGSPGPGVTKPSNEDTVETVRTHSQNLPSRLQSRGSRGSRGPLGPGSGTGPTGQTPTGPRPGEDQTRGVSPTRGRLSQSQGIPKPPANQQPVLRSAGRPAPSKLPVKGLPTIPSCLSPGSKENNGGPGRANGSRAEDRISQTRTRTRTLQTRTPTVDKNKPAKSIINHNLQQQKQKQQQQQKQKQQQQHQAPSDQVPEMVAANVAVMSLPPVPADPGSGSARAPGLGIKVRPGSRSSLKTASHLQNASRPMAADGLAKENHSRQQAEKKNQAVHQLRKLLDQGNRRVEALATVIQHLFTERDEALKQKKNLSVELSNLRDELAASSLCCQRLQEEKEEVRLSLEEALRRLEEQHREELEQLENRLRSFYQTEWDKVHQTYQEEADRCRTLMEQQVEDLRSRQEAERTKQEVTHSQKMESLQQLHDTSVQEMRRIQQENLEKLEETLKETEASLSEKIAELSAEKEDLMEQLRAEGERRRCLQSDKSLKDSHTLYLQQELESLKVVLEMKTNQLHQKEKKIMEMDKLVETNVKLEECMKKIQQENEDYKARMDKHAAMSKQLSSEHSKLQQTLQTESQVNKRLSMENEELLWKLHHGELLASPRGLSPPYGSPRSSASFPTAPLSPR